MSQRKDFQRCTGEGKPQSFGEVGMVETIGKRQEQQDALIAFTLPQFKELDENNRKKALQDTVDEMQKTHGYYEDQGSTLCGTITWKEKNKLIAYTTNLGDSTAYVVILDEEGNLKNCERLNKLHNYQNKEELTRVEKAKGFFFKEKLAALLSVSRAIADTKFEKVGLSHETETTNKTFDLSEGDQAFIIVACDGMTEGEEQGLQTEDIGTLVSLDVKRQLHPEKIADNLRKAAQSETVRLGGTETPPRSKYPSKDNISIAVMSVNTTPTGAFVFDGHGPEREKCAVSEALGKHFFPSLKMNVVPGLKALEALKQTYLSLLNEYIGKREKSRIGKFTHLHSLLAANQTKEILEKMSANNLNDCLSQLGSVITTLQTQGKSKHMIGILTTLQQELQKIQSPQQTPSTLEKK